MATIQTFDILLCGGRGKVESREACLMHCIVVSPIGADILTLGNYLFASKGCMSIVQTDAESHPESPPDGPLKGDCVRGMIKP